ncbi:putative choline kinase domain protein [[Clostridium] sordellii ATCC 9714]|nr:putative choline kinase domain protein [[Clostridium] sordellii ATCC 9714] [Paeniclostridium sordellii ATCC 9714]
MNFNINCLYNEINGEERKQEYNSIKKMLSKILNISENNVCSIEPVGGMTNKSFKVFINNEYYILRIPGNGADKIISRYDEKYNSLIANDLELDTDNCILMKKMELR